MTHKSLPASTSASTTKPHIQENSNSGATQVSLVTTERRAERVITFTLLTVRLLDVSEGRQCDRRSCGLRRDCAGLRKENQSL